MNLICLLSFAAAAVGTHPTLKIFSFKGLGLEKRAAEWWCLAEVGKGIRFQFPLMEFQEGFVLHIKVDRYSHNCPSCILLKENLPGKANMTERKEIISPNLFPLLHFH
jgi:hypothetical protein